MLKNYIKIAFRNLKKKVGFTIINVVGLSIGITSCLLLLLFVQDEWSYDNFHKDSQSIYRIAGSYDQGGEERNRSAVTTFLLAPELTSVAGVDQWARIQATSGLVRLDDQVYQEDYMLAADSTFFKVFDFELLKGNPGKVLNGVNQMVLSQEMAIKYFGETDPIGKILIYEDISMEVTGVMENFPINSHIKADFVISMPTMIPFYPNWILTNRSGTSHYTYIKTSEGFDPEDISQSLIKVVDRTYEYDNKPEYFLQPLESIHLNSDLNGEISANGDQLYTYIFLTVGFLILLIACINYMNMSISKSVNRSKEVGLRKIVGASRGQLILQHLTESVIIALFAMLLSGFLTELLLPYFNDLSGKAIEQSIITDFKFVGGLLLLGIVIGVLSGSYPAFYLSGFKALNVVTGEKMSIKGGVLSFRKILVVLQFTITGTLLAGTLLINQQLAFMSNKKLGMNTDGVVYLTLPTQEIRSKSESLKTEFLSLSAFTTVTVSNNNPTSRVGNWRGYTFEDKEITIPTIVVGHDYFETLETELVSGRTFSEEFKSDKTKAYILNEAAVAFLESEDPLGSSLRGSAYSGSQWTKKDAQIIGVVKDFHFTSLHADIQPAVFSLASELTTPINYMILRYNSDNMQAVLGGLNTVWDKYANGRPIDFTFMNDEIQQLYDSEVRFLKVFLIFSSIAIIIACLGALSLISYTVSQMTRQIGIRKVLGAPVWGLVRLVNQSFFQMILVSFLLSIPLSYYLINNWLEGFAYKISVGVVPYLQAGILIVLIAGITTSFQSVKAALVNPVDSLKEE
jgi:putative ABC transport system permease protein